MLLLQQRALRNDTGRRQGSLFLRMPSEHAEVAINGLIRDCRPAFAVRVASFCCWSPAGFRSWTLALAPKA